MKIIILGSQVDDPSIAEDSYYQMLTKFWGDAAGAAASVDYALFSQLVFEVKDGRMFIYDTRHACELKEYDAFFIRGRFRQRLDIAYVISMYAHAQHKLVVNDYSHARTSSKLSQAFIFAELGIPTPHTVSGSAGVLLASAEKIAFPFICKDVYGAHGHNNYLVHDVEQLKRILAQNESRQFVLQEYIRNDGDYRVLCIGDEYIVIKRTAVAGSHLNNTSQGGSAELLSADSLPESTVEQCRQIMKRMGMQIAGLDVIYDSAHDRYLFLEVNSQPQLVTGAFLDAKKALLGEYLKKLSA